jgi:hypothetical protein
VGTFLFSLEECGACSSKIWCLLLKDVVLAPSRISFNFYLVGCSLFKDLKLTLARLGACFLMFPN